MDIYIYKQNYLYIYKVRIDFFHSVLVTSMVNLREVMISIRINYKLDTIEILN